MAKDKQDMTARMRQLEASWPVPTPEDWERVRRVLETYDALDVAPLLGLSA